MPLVTLPPRPLVTLDTPSVTTVPPTVQIDPVLAALGGEYRASRTRLPITPMARGVGGGVRIVAYCSTILRLRLGTGPKGSSIALFFFSDRLALDFELAKSKVSFAGVVVLVDMKRSGVRALIKHLWRGVAFRSQCLSSSLGRLDAEILLARSLAGEKTGLAVGVGYAFASLPVSLSSGSSGVRIPLLLNAIPDAVALE